MDLFPRLRVVYSTSHMFFPRIVIGILIFLGACIVIKNVVIRLRTHQPLFNKDWKFFVVGADYLMLGGSLALFILYVWLLGIIGFLASSLVCIFLFNQLFSRTLKLKSILVSLVISVISSVGVWYLFSVVFNIHLP